MGRQVFSEAEYSLQVIAPHLIQLLKEVVQ
jgi:hypothetical protein